MASWVAVSFGALDVHDHVLGAGEYRYLVAPVRPGVPVMLSGDGAAIWERLVRGPLRAEDLDAEELVVVEEMEAMGIASRDFDDEARVREVNAPWLSSPIHELVYAILGRVADQSGVELVFIKGPTLHAQGLRTREHSGDVDCWVAPGSDVRFARAMQSWGWRPAFSAFTGTGVLHSLTLRAPEWGCAVDVHGWFPGMTMSHQDAFEQVQRSSESRMFAGYLGKTPDRAMHAVISALHDVRPSGGHGPSEHHIDRAAETLSMAGESVTDIAVQTGAEFALRGALSHAFPDHPIDYNRARVPPDWSWRMQSTMPRTYLAALRSLPFRERGRALFRILWPTPESLLAGPTAQESGATSVRELRVRRATRGFREMMTVLRRRRR
ncbi:hypothetical protein [Microbacterium sp. EST19A]|uniref:hypothetical protein n=1 Tax=Microbacterium sp. EST19A TaxID=2862681 RepID=UPI001CC05775|nr:hypothetical protein [Microbacterium sp. EST19A]